jgi:tetratricopeptide (TPR) repeat protein
MLAWLNEARSQQAAGKAAEAQTAMANAQAAFGLAEQAYLDVIGFVPTEYDNYVFLSSLYNQSGSYFDPSLFAKSIANADVGIKVEPYGPAIRFQKAIAYWSQGKTEETIAVLKDAVDIDPQYAEPRQLYIEALKAAGRLPEARAQAIILVKLHPDNTSYPPILKSIEASMGVSAPATGAAPASATP